MVIITGFKTNIKQLMNPSIIHYSIKYLIIKTSNVTKLFFYYSQKGYYFFICVFIT